MDLVVPKLGESISEAIVAKWLKNVGDRTAQDEPVVELETDKVTVALPAPAAGVLSEQKYAVGATVKVGEIIGSIAPGEGSASEPAAQPPGPTPRPESPAQAASTPPPLQVPERGAAAPQAAPSVPHARTLPPSVRKALREGAMPSPGPRPPGPAQVGPAPIPAPARALQGAREEIVSMSPLRRRIAQRLVEAQQTAAILTTFNEVDLSEVMALRQRQQQAFTAKHGIKLGFMSFFVRACVESLCGFPGLNAELRGTDIVYKQHYDFGIAVGGGKGLVVPVVRDVDQRGFADIEKEIARLAQRARDNQLTLDELSGGTFTITNGGIYGSMLSTPLLNMPQTGILGMHNIVRRPIAVGAEVQIRPMMYLALSYDHRVVDGREAVQFLIGVKERLEAPERLLLAI